MFHTIAYEITLCWEDHRNYKRNYIDIAYHEMQRTFKNKLIAWFRRTPPKYAI